MIDVPDNLPERLNWKQACELLGCKKDTFYRLIREDRLKAYGVGKRCRWVMRSDCEAFLDAGEKRDEVAS